VGRESAAARAQVDGVPLGRHVAPAVGGADVEAAEPDVFQRAVEVADGHAGADDQSQLPVRTDGISHGAAVAPPADAKLLRDLRRVPGAEGPAAGGGVLLEADDRRRIARADLLTEVVQEFPTLQGEMGAIYAREEEKHPDVCEAIREAYLPRGEGDALPETRCGTSLAVADKLDTIVCAFATGRKPTGSKDPFMVRRNTLGVLRILRERELDLGYAGLVEKAVALLPEGLGSDSVAAEVDAYFRGRLRQLARDETKAPDLVEAALEAGRDPTSVHDFWTRLAALRALAEDERFPRLRELVERSKNITDKNGPDVDPADVAPERLEHPAERALHEAVAGCRDAVRAAIVERRYVEAGRTYVDALADVTHTFFEPAPEGVFVMDDDPRLRTNRLALLKQVHALLSDGFADLSRVAG